MIIRQLAIFILISFGFTWAFHFFILKNRWSVDKNPGRIFYWLGLPGPTLAAFAISASLAKEDELLNSLLRWPIGFEWVLLSLLTIPITYMSASFIDSRYTGKRLSRMFHKPESGWSSLLSSQLLVVVSEEFGWRGFALPLLIVLFGSLGGTLILGMLWALWHLPMFRVPTSHQKGSFWGFSYSLTAWSLIMTLTYIGSGRSILPAMLFHASANIAYFIVEMPASAERYSAWILGLIAFICILLLPDPLAFLNF